MLPHSDGLSHRSEECYQALLQYRIQRCTQHGDPIDNGGPSGLDIARLFSIEAGNSLSATEGRSIMQFLKDSPSSHHDVKFLDSEVSSLLSTFVAEETSLTGQPAHRLAVPSGQSDAGMGLVMHIQSKKGVIQEFWDKDSPSIQALAAKGLQPDFLFGFDWHHRAEDEARFRGRVTCPARHGREKWAKEQLVLHDNLSETLLKLLPLPVLVIAGSCAKESYQKTLGHHTRLLRLTIQPGAAIEIELDFQQDHHLRRLAIYVDHPSAAFFSPRPDTPTCIRLEASLNFALWLDGRRCVETYFTASRARGIIRGVPRAAPLAEMYSYIRAEQESGKILSSDSYDPNFLMWAERYLGEKPLNIISKDNSLAKAVHQKLSANMRIRHNEPDIKAQHTTNNRRRNQVRYGITYAEYWHGREVRIRSNGRVPIFIAEDQRALILCCPKSILQLTQASVYTPTIMFCNDGVFLKLGDQVIYQRSKEALLKTNEGLRWKKQFEKELGHIV